jgi:hypothetical protein
MTRVPHMVLWIAALLLGALVPALIVAVFTDLTFFLPVFAVTLGHAIILGLPVALVYRRLRWTRLYAAIAGGFFIGSTPAGVMFWPYDSSGQGASVDGVPTIINGMPTPAGWLQYLELLGTLGAFGAEGGFVFWFVLWWFGALDLADRK